MKQILTLTLILVLSFILKTEAQSLNQDTEGYSTIVIPSTSLNLDIANNIASFNYYTYLKKDKKTPRVTDNPLITGVELKAKEKDGIGDIFSNQNVVVDASIRFLLGKKWYSENSGGISNPTDYKFKLNEIKIIEEKMIKKEVDGIKYLDKLLLMGSIDTILYRQAKILLSNNSKAEIEVELSKIEALKIQLAEDLHFKRNITADGIDAVIAVFDNNYLKELDARKAALKITDAYESEDWYPVFKRLFFRGGASAASFKRDLDNGTETIKERFRNETFNGWNLELGFNIQKNDFHFFGLSYTFDFTNNITGLDNREFTFTTTDASIIGGSFSSSTKINALAGDYDTFNRHSINFDYVKAIPIRDSEGSRSDLFLTLNPYFRHRMYQNSKKLKNNTVLGFGLNAFSSKKQTIVGGLFVQTNDLFGIHADDNSNLGKRIAVGILAKLNFSGINLERK